MPSVSKIVTEVIKITYAPFMLLGFVGSALALVSSGRLLWLAPLLISAIAASFLAEWVAPYRAEWNVDSGDRRRDFLHFAVNESSYVLAATLIPVLTLLSPFSRLWPSSWPIVVQLLFAVFVADAGITIAHYLSHRIGWLWRFHAVHHSLERLYGFNGLMKHPIHQAIEATAGVTPLVLLGMPLEVGALLGFAVAIQLLLQHSNVDMRIGPLRHVLALAPVHRFHHLKDGRVGNVNFGLFTTVWDHVLGTVAADPNRQFVPGDFGVEGRPDYPNDYLQQLIEPFRRGE